MARADRAFALLLALALGSSAILLALFASLLTRIGELVSRGPSGAADLVTVLVLILAVCGIGLGLGALCRQLLATAGLIRSLLRRRIAAPRRVAAVADALGLVGRIDVVEDERPFSFCYWFVRPRICVSTGLARRLAHDELRAVLLHERYHLRHRDPLRLVVARYFAACLYFVPFVEELLEYYALEKELAADQEAVREAGDVAPLARALYKVLPDADDVSLGLLVPVGSLSVTEARIEQLVDGRALPLALRPLSVALSSGALAGASVLSFVHGQALHAFDSMPPVVVVPTLLVAPASLLFAAAVSGGLQQLRLVTRRSDR
ncbi:hypothetical protein BH18CHL2_BH18CHL2_09140 [soil metagenome]